MIKLKTLKVLVLSLMLGLSVNQICAQRTDGFFSYSNDDYYRDGEGITIEGQSGGGVTHENPLPLGDGLLVLAAAGVGYAVLRNRKSSMLLLASALLLGMTQCRKKLVEPVETGTVFMTISAGSGDRTVFNPDILGFNWNETGYEYIVVSGNNSGCLGELSAPGCGGCAITCRKEFTGTITVPSAEDTELHFFYLGNGSHAQDNGTESLVIDFSNQVGGDVSTVTDYLIATEKIPTSEVEIESGQYHVTIDLKVKTAIAFFKLSGFSGTSSPNETVYLHGNDVFSSAEINFKTGEVTGKDKGFINVGTNDEDGVYISLIDSKTTTSTTLNFDSNSKTGSIVFPNGIKEKVFYSDELNSEFTPLPITAALSLPEGVLPGLFSVAPGKKVRFSKGNLQYTRPNLEASWDEGEWSFMEHQYDNDEIADLYDNNYASWYHDVGDDYCDETAVSFMGYGTTGKSDLPYPYNKPYDTDAEYEYGPTTGGLSVEEGTDWGWCMGGADSPWRTLSANEFAWLMGMANGNAYQWTENPGVNCRTASTVCGVVNARSTRARIVENDSKTDDGVNGMVIFPDDYTHPDGLADLVYINYFGNNDSHFSKANILTVDDWNRMEAAGAVFLPASGQRYVDWNTWDIVTYSTDVNIGGHYWTSTAQGTYSGRTFFFDGGHCTFEADMRLLGRSVRLVMDAE